MENASVDFGWSMLVFKFFFEGNASVNIVKKKIRFVNLKGICGFKLFFSRITCYFT